MEVGVPLKPELERCFFDHMLVMCCVSGVVLPKATAGLAVMQDEQGHGSAMGTQLGWAGNSQGDVHSANL